MKKLLTTALLLCVYLFSGYAQGNLINQKIQQARNSGETFEVATAFTPVRARSAMQTNRVQEQVFNPQEVYILHYNPSAVRNFGTSMTFQIPLGSRTKQLELREVIMDYVVETCCGQTLPPNRNIRHFQGVVKGDHNSLASMTFGEDEVIGIIATDEGNFNIAFDQQLGAHVFFNDRNAVHRHGFTCGTSCDGSFEGYCPDVLLGNINALNIDPLNVNFSSQQDTRVVRFFFETTTDIYDRRGGAGGVEAFVMGLFNQVQLLFLNEGVFTTVSVIRIWTRNDPYRNITLTNNVPQNLYRYLTAFQRERRSFDGDLGHLLTFRNLNGGGRYLAGVAASFNGLCNPNIGQRLAVSQIHNTSFPNFPLYSESVLIVTHEFGHLLGSRHTHACVWNGNNTAIDGCASTEGNCHRFQNPSVPGGGMGTIMSYCDMNVGTGWGQNPGIDFTLGFGPQPGNVVRHSVSQATCLRPLIQGPTVVCTGTFSLYNFNVPTFWNVSPGFNLSQPSWVASTSVTVTAYGNFGQTGTLTATPIWPAIEVTKTIQACAIATISGPNGVCPGQTDLQFSVPNLPYGATIEWTHGHGIAIDGPNDVHLITVRHSSPIPPSGMNLLLDPNSWIRAVVRQNGQIIHDMQRPVTVNRVNIDPIQAPLPPGSWYQIGALNRFTANHNHSGNLNWTVSPNSHVLISHINRTQVNIGFPAGGVYTITASMTNACGPSTPLRQITIEVATPTAPPCFCIPPCFCVPDLPVWPRFTFGEDREIIAHPNPVSDILTIDFTQLETFEARTDVRASEVFNVRLLNAHGMIVRQQRTQVATIQFDVSNLPEGTYYLHIEHNGEIEKHQIIVQRN